MAMIFLAGHGDSDNGKFYFFPYNVEDNRLYATGVKGDDIIEILTAPGKAIAFIDACHSGAIGAMGKTRSPDVNGIINEFIRAENSGVTFASCSARQTSLEIENNGAFTKALVEGLNGKGIEPKSQYISLMYLNSYICKRVKDLTAGAQTPVLGSPHDLADFPIAIVP
jgi:uncharacterized caspase-like protein